MSNQDSLPLDALPYLIRLMDLYKKSLEELIAMFHVEKNERTFSKLLDHLIDDFAFYQNTYVRWISEARTPDEDDQLQKLKPLLEEAETMISEAAALVRH